MIRSVGHDGSFIAEEHTVNHFRKELWMPELLDRRFWEDWVGDGKKEMRDRCIEMKEHIIHTHTPAPMDKNTIKEVEKVVDAARRHLV